VKRNKLVSFVVALDGGILVMKICVVHGGTSTEQAVSTLNATYIADSLSAHGYETEMVSYEGDIMGKLHASHPDAVYLCVQGKGHGDGTLQAMLDYLNIPYTGSHTTAAAVINNKIICKELFAYGGIRTPQWQTLSKCTFDESRYDFSPVGYPFVAKAPTQGGSYGLQLISSPEDIDKIADVFPYDNPILIERFIKGRFATIGLLETKNGLITLPCVESDGTNTGMDYSLPYRLIVFTDEFAVRKADFPLPVLQELDDLARRAFSVTRAKGYARLDFMVSQEDGLPYVLEINAVPGLKPQSLFPQASMIAGITYGDMIEDILLNAFVQEENRDV
jgi:D-alanine-D-alanine ligase